MAELSKVQVGTTVYNVKDTVARNKQVSQLSVSMDASGGTIAPKYADGSTGTGISIPIATEEKAGVMSAEDKQHLNAALNHVGETNYLPDYVWTPILSWNGDEEIVTIEAATKERAGVMSSADKKKLDGISSGVFIIDVGSEDNTTDDYKSFCADQNIRERLNAIDTTVPLFVRWWGVDGTAVLPVSVSYDSNEVIYTIWGDPLSWWSQEGEDANIIAIEYYSGEFVVDGFTSYRKVFATKGSEIAI